MRPTLFNLGYKDFCPFSTTLLAFLISCFGRNNKALPQTTHIYFLCCCNRRKYCGLFEADIHKIQSTLTLGTTGI